VQIRIGLNSGDVVKDQDTAFEIAQHFYKY